MAEGVPYIVGSVHGLRLKQRLVVEAFYEALGEVCETVLGGKAFLPHRHFNPGNFQNLSPAKEYDCIGTQVKYRTSHLVVITENMDGSEGCVIAQAAEQNIPMLFLSPGKKEVPPYIIGLLTRYAVEYRLDHYSSYSDARDRLEAWLIIGTMQPLNRLVMS